MLLGRSLEINYLRENYEKAGTNLLVVYGQKNVGKTALLKAFCENVPYHYYLARPCSERQQQYFWARQISQKNFKNEKFPSFSDILHTIVSEGERKKVIIIDEFQSFIKVNKTFVNDLLAFLQTTQKEAMVILCSSQVGFVENSLVSKIGSAAYAIQGFLKIKELDFQSLTDYFPKMSTKESIAVYAVFGGLPGIWRCLKDESAIKENICSSILQKHSIILADTLLVIEEQLRETNVYYTILAALAEGKEKLNDLHIHTGFSRAKISVYLKNLMELEIAEKVFSIDTEGRENTKKGVYRIKNKLLAFYFRFLYPHLSELAMWTPEFFYEEFIEEEIEDYITVVFPQICREYLEIMNAKGNLPIKVTAFGEWVGKAGTIPLAAMDEEDKSIICLCHFKKQAMPYSDYEWLLFCAQQAKLSADYVYLFSVCGFDAKINEEARGKANIVLIDMY